MGVQRQKDINLPHPLVSSGQVTLSGPRDVYYWPVLTLHTKFVSCLGPGTCHHHCMDPESPLLAPSPEYLAAVKVFPLIPALRKDIDVSIPVLF